MCSSQGMPPQSLGASPLNSPPLQKIIGLEMSEFVDGTIRRRLKQSPGKEPENINRNNLARHRGQKQPSILCELDRFSERFKAPVSMNLLPIGVPPGGIHGVGVHNVLFGNCLSNLDTVLFGEPDIPPAILREIAKYRFGAAGEIEYDTSVGLASTKAPR